MICFYFLYYLNFENSRLIVCHSGKANTVVALVEHRVELANEDITQNPEGDVRNN